MAARARVVVTAKDYSYELRKQNVVIVTWKNFISNITTWYDRQLLQHTREVSVDFAVHVLSDAGSAL